MEGEGGGGERGEGGTEGRGKGEGGERRAGSEGGGEGGREERGREGGGQGGERMFPRLIKPYHTCLQLYITIIMYHHVI